MFLIEFSPFGSARFVRTCRATHTVFLFIRDDDRKVRLCVRKKRVGKKGRGRRGLLRTSTTFVQFRFSSQERCLTVSCKIPPSRCNVLLKLLNWKHNEVTGACAVTSLVRYTMEKMLHHVPWGPSRKATSWASP